MEGSMSVWFKTTDLPNKFKALLNIVFTLYKLS